MDQNVEREMQKESKELKKMKVYYYHRLHVLTRLGVHKG